ncbi:hypothetical protein ACFQ4M_04085 [Thauera mechernichensis]|uniref:Uncharacterized protein n=1 Tax=Thauera mechernichensis TaxID=82788 RepID=A0ABW3WBV0_9RHOO|nr:hypothetical protein [Thauera mechernichensis]MDG3066690.1 hypothetical protein [Thauera mechernichensis]
MPTSVTHIDVALASPQALFDPNCALIPSELHPQIADMLMGAARTADEHKSLLVRIQCPTADAPSAEVVARIMHAHFTARARQHDQQIRDIFRFARVSSVLGLACVVVLLACAQAIPDDASKLMLGVRESLNIFAWVAMWRPAELWLYAHLPERHWRRLALRLAAAEVSVEKRTATG